MQRTISSIVGELVTLTIMGCIGVVAVAATVRFVIWLF